MASGFPVVCFFIFYSDKVEVTGHPWSSFTGRRPEPQNISGFLNSSQPNSEEILILKKKNQKW